MAGPIKSRVLGTTMRSGRIASSVAPSRRWSVTASGCPSNPPHRGGARSTQPFLSKPPSVRRAPAKPWRVSKSNRERVAVAARIGARHEGAGRGVAHEPLPASDDPRPIANLVHLVAARGQPGANLGGDARLRVDEAVAIDAPACPLDRLLDVDAELENVEQHLRRRLENSVGAGRADRQ